MVTRNLNRVIDVNFYPVEEAKRSNMRHRPVGLGVQGLADAFIMVSYYCSLSLYLSFVCAVQCSADLRGCWMFIVSPSLCNTSCMSETLAVTKAHGVVSNRTFS